MVPASINQRGWSGNIRRMSWDHPSNWLDWLKSLDWSHLDNILSSIVGVTVIAGIVWAAIKFLWNPLFERLGRRRAQAKLLDKLACGSSVAYIETVVGAPQFISTEDGREQRTYRLRGAWVMIEVDASNNSVYAFSITVTSRWMFYRTKRLTFGYLKVKLGRTKFGDHGIGFTGERYWIGARRVGYMRSYAYGNPGGYQSYWLSYNMSGAGVFSTPKDQAAMFVENGIHCADIESPARDNLKSDIDATGITINTLTVLGPEGSVDQIAARHVLGPDESRVRLALTIKHPTGLTWRGGVRRRFYLTRYSLFSRPIRSIKSKMNGSKP